MKNQKRQNALQAIYAARRQVNPIERAELDNIVEIWVDAALRLGDRDLKMMERIVRAQMKRMDAAAADAVAAMPSLAEPQEAAIALA
jgi:DSF synthase